MSKHPWVRRPAIALAQAVIATVVAVATVGACYAVLLGPVVAP